MDTKRYQNTQDGRCPGRNLDPASRGYNSEAKGYDLTKRTRCLHNHITLDVRFRWQKKKSR